MIEFSCTLASDVWLSDNHMLLTGKQLGMSRRLLEFAGRYTGVGDPFPNPVCETHNHN